MREHWKKKPDKNYQTYFV